MEYTYISCTNLDGDVCSFRVDQILRVDQVRERAGDVGSLIFEPTRTTRVKEDYAWVLLAIRRAKDVGRR